MLPLKIKATLSQPALKGEAFLGHTEPIFLPKLFMSNFHPSVNLSHLRRKHISLILFFMFAAAPFTSADSKILIKEEPKKPLKEDVFSVSTQDLDSSDSLNRIAGNYDTGYSSPEQSYKPKEHAGAGPFAHERAETSGNNSY